MQAVESHPGGAEDHCPAGRTLVNESSLGNSIVINSPSAVVLQPVVQVAVLGLHYTALWLFVEKLGLGISGGHKPCTLMLTLYCHGIQVPVRNHLCTICQAWLGRCP